MDLSVPVSSSRLTTSIHYKPTVAHNLLHYFSNHPKCCKDSIPLAQILRLRRLGSDNDYLIQTSQDMSGFFRRHFYPTHILDAELLRVSQITRPATFVSKTPHIAIQSPLEP